MKMKLEFELGKAYYATPAIKGQQQRLVVPIGRQGGTIMFAVVGGLWCAQIVADASLGREYSIVTGEDGRYCVSAAARATDSDRDIVKFLIASQASTWKGGEK